MCAHLCHLRPGQTGRCFVRHNVGGELVTSAYGRPALLAVEPIEKKYLFHFLPGSRTLSLGTAGCNLGCKYCINWRISQTGPTGAAMGVTPEDVVAQAVAAGVEIIAFTYTEPTIFFEYARDIAHLARQAGLAVGGKGNCYLTPDARRARGPCCFAAPLRLPVPRVSCQPPGWGHARSMIVGRRRRSRAAPRGAIGSL